MTISEFRFKVKKFNELDADIFPHLYQLTLYKNTITSGMTYELNNLKRLSKVKKVDAKVILAYKEDKLVAWALMSRECSNFKMSLNEYWFNPLTDGILFEIFVDKNFRRMGIGTEIVKIAKKKAYPYNLCFVPWNEDSSLFYQQFKNIKHKFI